MYSKYKDYLEQPQRELKTWKAALYIRLSREDGDKSESYSITSQREILKEYLKLHPDIEAHDFYVDDGWSGTNFDRPDWQRLISMVEDGKVGTVIVKDMSEWTTAENDALIDELIGADVRHKRFLLVSNTGRLLPFFCDRCNRVGATCSRAAIEDALLTAFDASQEKRFSFGPAKFSVWNLARQDNVGLGMQMFKRMVDVQYHD